MSQIDLGRFEFTDSLDRGHGELEIELRRGSGRSHDAHI